MTTAVDSLCDQVSERGADHARIRDLSLVDDVAVKELARRDVVGADVVVMLGVAGILDEVEHRAAGGEHVELEAAGEPNRLGERPCLCVD